MEKQKCTSFGADDKCCAESSKLSSDEGSTNVSIFACPMCKTIPPMQGANFCFKCGHDLQGRIAEGVEPKGKCFFYNPCLLSFCSPSPCKEFLSLSKM